MKSLAFLFFPLTLSWCFSISVAAQNVNPPRKNVAILLFEGVEIIDYTGPYEVLGAAGMEVFTVSQDGKLLRTGMNMQVTPNYAFENCPEFDILVLPGGGSSIPGGSGVGKVLANSVMMDWVKKKSAEASYVMSVCNGAFILAHAGLLDGQEATTFWRMIPALDSLFPGANVVSDKRFTDNGKIITTAGLTSGIDGAFHLVEKLSSRGRAQHLALGLEYNWQPNGDFARAALADKHLRFWFPDDGKSESLSREGTREQWESKWRIWDVSAEKFFAGVNASIEKKNTWTTPHVEWQKDDSQPSIPLKSVWKFQDEHEHWWRGIVAITPIEGSNDAHIFSISVEKVKPNK